MPSVPVTGPSTGDQIRLLGQTLAELREAERRPDRTKVGAVSDRAAGASDPTR